ncbi:MAG: hypothetical protein ACK4Z0_04085 [Sphingomonadaceae bacterium]
MDSPRARPAGQARGAGFARAQGLGPTDNVTIMPTARQLRDLACLALALAALILPRFA